MILCDDPQDETCEKDLENLCPPGFHLCFQPEFVALNDNWQYIVPSADTPVGGIYLAGRPVGGIYCPEFLNVADAWTLTFRNNFIFMCNRWKIHTILPFILEF